MQFRVGVAPSEIAVEARQARGRMIPPSILAETVRCQVHAEIVAMPAVFDGAVDELGGAALNRSVAAGEVEARLHLYIHRAAERVEAEQRIAGPGIGAIDGDFRD